MDVTKLSPAPWIYGHSTIMHEAVVLCRIKWPEGEAAQATVCRMNINCPLTEDHQDANAEAIAMMRNDFDVKQRRGWHTEKCESGDEWRIPQVERMLLVRFGYDLPDWARDICYQEGHDIGLLSRADEWAKLHLDAKEPT